MKEFDKNKPLFGQIELGDTIYEFDMNGKCTPMKVTHIYSRGKIEYGSIGKFKTVIIDPWESYVYKETDDFGVATSLDVVKECLEKRISENISYHQKRLEYWNKRLNENLSV